LEGNGVGSFDGGVVNLCVGLVDGFLVGIRVVGCFVGLSLGDDVGFFDGDLLGVVVGLCENGSKIKRIGEQ